MRRCPICSKTLESKKYKDITVDECPNDHGMFFDRDELNRAKDSADPDLRFLDFDLFEKQHDQVLESGLTCPKCHASMQSVHYGNSKVSVNVCAHCRGVWLDKKEFEKIIAYLESFVESQTADELMNLTSEEFSEIFSGQKSVQEELKDFAAVSKLLEMRYVAEHPLLEKILEMYYLYTPLR